MIHQQPPGPGTNRARRHYGQHRFEHISDCANRPEETAPPPNRAVSAHVTARITEAGVITARSIPLGEAALARTMNAA